MDIFKGIDWNPSLNDIIDDEFINGDRLERESVMYRILRGTFTDPLKDIHEDYKDLVTPKDIEAYDKEKEQEKEDGKSKKFEDENEKKIAEELTVAKFIKYFPGIVRPNIKWPRMSSLSVEQQEACLRVILHFSAPGKPDVSKINKDDLEIYGKLQTIISEEQKEFLEIAKENWKPTELKLIREDLINRKWKHKMKYIMKLPRFYVENGTIPLKSDKEINISFNSTPLEKGSIPRLILPPLTHRTQIHTKAAPMEKQYFTFSEENSEKNLISADPNCQNLIESNDIDLVISSSGLNCLANNLDSSYTNSWTLPLIIKEINGKNVAFIDKSLPPLSRNIIQKNSWVFKYFLKSYVLHPGHNTSINLENNNSKDFDKSEEEETEESLNSEEKSTNSRNFSYNIFTIGACGSQQNELMKNKVERDYKILVRTKIDGIEVFQKKQMQYVIIAPKLENQLGIGAEAVTLEEASKQWISLTSRPDTALIRVRINPKNAEIIQYERRTAISVNNEIKRLYNVKGEDSLSIIYNVAKIITKLSPGKYLIKHTPRNGAFACIYKESEESGKNTIDLQALYGDEEFLTIPNAPWPLIDKVVPLPAHECFNRMPAMFHPKKKNPDNNNKNNNRLRKNVNSQKPSVESPAKKTKKTPKNRGKKKTNKKNSPQKSST